MKRFVPALNDAVGLERKSALLVFALLALSCATYFMLEAQHKSFALLICGIGALISGIAHFSLFKPLRALAIMAKAVGSGDFSRRLRFRRRDEIGSLALEMDTMCDQLEAAQLAADAHLIALDQLRHSDRIATLGRLASSVAHELGNPLNVIELRAQLITSGGVATLAQAQQNAVVIVEQTRRMTCIIDEILSFARMRPTKITRLELVSVLRKAITLSEHTSKQHKTSIRLDVPTSAMEIDGDPDKLVQIVVNLVVNGVQAMPRGGIVRVSLRDERRAPIDDPDGAQRDYVCIDVADQGVGIPEELLPRVFEPFFSTKCADGGTGLGLSVAQGIAREHEGWITVESEVGRGTSFKVHLPKHGLKGSNGHAAG